VIDLIAFGLGSPGPVRARMQWHKIPDGSIYSTVISRYSEAIRKYASEWSYNSSDPKEVERKIEELVWMNVIIYGVAGYRIIQAVSTLTSTSAYSSLKTQKVKSLTEL
jgi:hypothetical protein